MYCCLHNKAGALASLLYIIIHCSPAPVLVHKLVGLLESIEKLPIYLYESSTSYSLQVGNINEHHLLMCVCTRVHACVGMCVTVCMCVCVFVDVCTLVCVHACICVCYCVSLCMCVCSKRA